MSLGSARGTGLNVAVDDVALNLMVDEDPNANDDSLTILEDSASDGDAPKAPDGDSTGRTSAANTGDDSSDIDHHSVDPDFSDI
jgi:hypothetical protein